MCMNECKYTGYHISCDARSVEISFTLPFIQFCPVLCSSTPVVNVCLGLWLLEQSHRGFYVFIGFVALFLITEVTMFILTSFLATREGVPKKGDDAFSSLFYRNGDNVLHGKKCS